MFVVVVVVVVVVVLVVVVVVVVASQPNKQTQLTSFVQPNLAGFARSPHLDR